MPDTLEVLVAKLHEAENRLQEHTKGGKPKWNWPAEIVNEVQYLAAQINDIVSKELDALLHWPKENLLSFERKHPDHDLFYNKNYDSKFDRSKDWFGEMGFTKFETPYTIAANWDRQYINATFLVPNNLSAGDKVPAMWFFHGGGFVTGAGDHIPWYSRATLKHAYDSKAIVIAPDYPLGPEANYHDIFHALRDFLRFYRMNGCFVKGEKHWTEWLMNQTKKDITIDRDDIFIEGESAGGHATITALFENAMKVNSFKLPIKVVLLRYPMIKHYKRAYPPNGEITFMGRRFTIKQMEEGAQAIKQRILEIEVKKIRTQTGFMRTRTKGYSPQYMWPAPVLSLSGLWQWMFQREHGAGELRSSKTTEIKNLDYLDRVEKMVSIVEHKFLPPIVMHHAPDDANCPYDDTVDFKDRLHEFYPAQYPRKMDVEDTVTDEKVYLMPVKQLLERDGIKNNASTEVGHGYDYWQLDEPFITMSYGHVKKYWPKA